MAASSAQLFDFELLEAADGTDIPEQDFVLVAATSQLAADDEPFG